MVSRRNGQSAKWSVGEMVSRRNGFRRNATDSLAFIANSFRVTEENLVFNMYSMANTLLLNVLLLLFLRTHFYILFNI